MPTGFKQGCQCIKQSGGDSPKPKRVSPKEKPLLNVPHCWQVGNVNGLVHQIGYVCRRNRKCDFYLSSSDFPKHMIIKIKSITGLRDPSFQPGVTWKHEHELHRWETRQDTHPCDAPQGKIIEKGAAFSHGNQHCEQEMFSSAQNVKTLKMEFLLLSSSSSSSTPSS